MSGIASTQMDLVRDGVTVKCALLQIDSWQREKRIVGVEQGNITNRNPGAEIPQSQNVIISYDVSQIRGRRRACPWPVPCNSTTLEGPPTPPEPPWKAETRFSAWRAQSRLQLSIHPAPAHIAASQN